MVAYLSLGIAAGIKIAPAIFGLLLLREFKMKEVTIAFVFGCVIFFLPFMFTDGNLFILMHNIAHTDNMQDVIISQFVLKNVGSGLWVNLSSTFAYWGRLFNFNAVNFAEMMNVVVLFLGMAEVVLIKRWELWKITGLLCGILVIVPGFSAIYNLIYMVIPLLLFLNSHPKFSKLNMVYLILFLGMFIPGINLKIEAFNIFFMDRHPLSIMTVIESMSILAFVVLLSFDGLYILCKERFASRPIYIKAIGFLCVVSLLFAGYFWKCMEKPVEAFYPANMQVINAGKGFKLVDGQYLGMTDEAQILIKSDKILYDGLSINFGETLRFAETPETVKIFVNDQLVESHVLDNSMGSDYVYIPASFFREHISSETLRIKLVRVGADKNSEILPVNYIGYAKPLDGLPAEYIGYAVKQIHQSGDGGSFWIGQNARMLINYDTCKKGIIFKYTVPRELIIANPEKEIRAAISANGIKIKELLLDKVGSGTLILNPADFGDAILAAGSENNLIEIGIDVNASFTNRKMNIDTDSREKSICIDYFGKVSKLKNIQDIKLGKNEKIYFLTSEIEDSGLALIYKVPSKLFSAAVGTKELKVYLDGREVLKKNLFDKNRDYEDIIVLPSDLFKAKNGIMELQLKQAPFDMMDGVDILPENKIEVSYIGPLYQIDSITAKDFFTDAVNNDNVWTSEKEWFPDKMTQSLYMGSSANLFLWKAPFTREPLHIKYLVEPYLFTVAKGSPISVGLWLNGIKLRDIVVENAGEFDCSVSADEINNASGGNACLHFELRSNLVYNLEKMHMSRAKELTRDRSIGILYFGFENE
jgi:hypothetical protein